MKYVLHSIALALGPMRTIFDSNDPRRAPLDETIVSLRDAGDEIEQTIRAEVNAAIDHLIGPKIEEALKARLDVQPAAPPLPEPETTEQPNLGATLSPPPPPAEAPTPAPAAPAPAPADSPTATA